MAHKKSLQQILAPIYSDYLDRRLEWTNTHPHQRLPSDLSFSALARFLNVQRDTLRRWIRGEVKTTKKVDIVARLIKIRQKIVRRSRERLKKVGGEIGAWAREFQGVVSLPHYQHGGPAWRVETRGWSNDKITRFVGDLLSDPKRYHVSFLLWAPDWYKPDDEDGMRRDSQGRVHTGHIWIGPYIGGIEARKAVRVRLNYDIFSRIAEGDVISITLTLPPVKKVSLTKKYKK